MEEMKTEQISRFLPKEGGSLCSGSASNLVRLCHPAQGGALVAPHHKTRGSPAQSLGQDQKEANVPSCSLFSLSAILTSAAGGLVLRIQPLVNLVAFICFPLPIKLSCTACAVTLKTTGNMDV